jgi:hypothetical protein
MQYLILKHTPYEYIKDSFDIVSTTDNLDEANNRLQGYQLIDEDKSVSYSILKYEKPPFLNKRGSMTKIRMNTELRNKLFNKIKNVFENEDTQEREAFLQAREEVDSQYGIASQHLQKKLLKGLIQQKMLQHSELSKRSMDNLVMLLQKINVFTLHTMRTKMMRAIQRN